jgi:predicted transposase/invertase (TIGR01784 family)
MNINNPHDRYFKAVFSKKDEAIDLIRNNVDVEISESLDFSTLKLENTSYVDDKLNEHFSDLVFSCKLKQEKILISILFEHKSYVPKFPHLQLMRYMMNIWDKQLKSKRTKYLRRILPIYIYHGQEKWSVKSFNENFGGTLELLNEYTPEFRYFIIDLSKFTDKQIEDTYHDIYARTSLLLLKNYFDERILNKNLFSYLSNLKVLVDNISDDYVTKTIIYILSSTNIESEIVADSFKNVSKEKGELVMTTAERLIKEGKKEGKKNYISEQIIYYHSEMKFDIYTIAKLLRVEEKYVSEILNSEKVDA